MKSQSDRFFADVAPVRHELEQWRRTRPRKGPIPEALWRSIARLGRRYGVSRMAQHLRVPFYGLRDRVQGSHRTESSGTQRAQGRFVEVPLNLAPAPAECVVELEDESGSKMTLRLSPATAADAAALIQTFRGSNP